MDVSKSYEFFNPALTGGSTVHIIGCGSVGSTVAENLARCGITKFALWDFDTVEAHNIVNQMFTEPQIGKPKTEALKEIITAINPDAAGEIELHPDGWKGEILSGFVFLAVDSIEIRRDFVEKHQYSPYVKAVFDIRTLLESAQHYAADWKSSKDKKNLLATMQFSHEEAAAETPVSACGITLGVATTVRLISALAVNNFIGFLKGRGLKTVVLMDGFAFTLTAFPMSE